MAPLYALYMCLAGISPTRPGFAEYEVRPQPAHLPGLALTARTPLGPIGVDCKGQKGNRELRLALPGEGKGVLVLDARETPPLPPLGPGRDGLRRYALPAGREVVFSLSAT